MNATKYPPVSTHHSTRIAWALCVLFVCLHFPALAQKRIEGRILDKQTGEALPFVNISAGGTYGTTTNIDGVFSLEVPATTKSLHFSYIGYQPLLLPIDLSAVYPFLTVYLNISPTVLDEVIIGADLPENPARRIMRKVIRNKEQHRPESLDFFSFSAYRKLILSPVFTNPDAFPSLQESYKKRHLGVMETYSTLFYERKGGFLEDIEAVKASGLKEPRFATLASQVPFFSFYQESFQVFERNFASPIADGALRRYDYQLTDTLYSGRDSVFVIAYRPKISRSFEGLSGVLYINNDGYAVQNVIAEPAEQQNLELRIEQQYERTKGRWFPTQLLYRVRLSEYPSKEFGTNLESRTYLSNVAFAEARQDRPRKWGSASVKVQPAAYQRDSLAWEALRPRPLDSLEQFTYQYLDSLAKTTGLRLLENLFNSTLDGLYPLGPISLRTGDLIHYNDYERLRPGIGLQTNSAFSSRLSLGGYLGVGFRDGAWKYAFDVSGLLFPAHDVRLQASYRNTVEEPAMPSEVGFATFLQAGYTRRLMAARMNHLRVWEASLSARPLKRLSVHFSLQDGNNTPLFAYRFQPEQQPAFAGYQFQQATLSFAFFGSGKGILRQANQITTVLRRERPLLSVRATSGQIFPEGQQPLSIAYQRYEAVAHKLFRWKGGGHFLLRTEGGLVQGDVPYPLLFNGSGSRAEGYPYMDVLHTFRTMDIYEFAYHRFVNVFTELTTGRPLFAWKCMRPEPVLLYSSGWGALTRTNSLHEGIALQGMERGFHEAGLQLHHLLSFNYINIARLGVGAGVFYRHGAYALPNTSDNLRYTLLLRFAF